MKSFEVHRMQYDYLPASCYSCFFEQWADDARTMVCGLRLAASSSSSLRPVSITRQHGLFRLIIIIIIIINEYD